MKKKSTTSNSSNKKSKKGKARLPRLPQYMPNLTRHAILTIALVCVVLGGWVAFMEYATQTLNTHQEEIAETLKKEIGFPIQYSSLESHWRGGYIMVDVNDVILNDLEKPVPFLSVKKLTLSTNPFRFLFKKENKFNRLIFNGMKMVLGWGEDKKLTVLGLEGEDLPSEFDYNSLLKSLASQESVVIKHSEITWYGPETEIHQNINGTFSWLDQNEASWVFKGKQQLKINEGQTLPNSNLMLVMDRASKKFKIIADLERSSLESDLQFQNDQPSLNANLEVRDLDLQMIHQSIILHENSPEWARWLVESLEKGVVTKGNFKIAGILENLDWQGNASFRQVDLRYSQDWPKLKRAEGKIDVKKDNITINVTNGKIHGTHLKKADALITKLNEDPYSTVVVKGELQGPLEKGIQFLEASPLKESSVSHLSSLSPTGSMDLELTLEVPLGSTPGAQKKPVTVAGKLEVSDGQVIIEDLNLPITEIEGIFNFTEKGVTAENVTGGFLDRPLKIEVTPTEVKTNTVISTDFLKEKISSPYLNYLHGQSDMTISFLIDSSEWKIESTLKGIAVDLPAPFGKTAENELPITVLLPPTSQEENKIGLSIKGLMDAKWVLEKKEEEWVLKSGNLVLGGTKKSDWTTAKGLLINGEIDELNVDEWKLFLGKLEEELPQRMPLQINVLMKKMEAFGLTLNNTWLSYNSAKSSEWILEGPLLKGSLHLPTSKNKRLEFDLDYLRFSSTFDGESTFVDFLKNKERIPSIFTCRYLFFNKAWFGEVNFRLEPTTYGYAIEDLSSRTPLSTLEAKGEWRLSENGETTRLQGQVVSDNMSRTFSQWGFNSSLQEAKGRIQFNLLWPTSPFAVDLKTMEGQADVKLRSGRIVGVDPGLGKILGLLSVDSLIRRRLQLDFSDVVKKGFVFDTLDAQLQFQGGVARTDNLAVDGPAAKIKIAGVANLKTKEVDLQMIVQPMVGGTLPIAAGLATGNPAVGVGVWFVDKMIGSPLSKVSQHRYHVTGTWDAPRMQEQGVQGRRKK